MLTYDVIVIGGGPAGSIAATLSAQRGLTVALIEQKRFPRRKVCGDVINPRCWPILETVGVAEKVSSLTHKKLEGAVIVAADGSQLVVPHRGGSPLIAMARAVFDACLLDHARDHSVNVIDEETVIDLTPRWRVITNRRELSGRIVIAADGRNSFVARKLRLDRDNIRPLFSGQRFVAFQGHFPISRSREEFVRLYLFSGGYCGVARVDEEMLNLCLVVNSSLAKVCRDWKFLLSQTVRRNAAFDDLGISLDPQSQLHSAFPLRSTMRRPVYHEVAFVGDALRVLEPFTGQGIYFALRSAQLAIESISPKGILEEDQYVDAVDRMYRDFAKTNLLLNNWMYSHTMAQRAMAVLRHCPPLLRWAAGNVLHE